MWAAGFRRLPVVEVRTPPLLGQFYPPQSDLDTPESRFSEELKLLQRSSMASAPPPVARERFVSPGGACGMPQRAHPNPANHAWARDSFPSTPECSSTFSLRCSEYEMRGIAPASFARSAELAPPTMGRWRSPSLVYRPSAVAGAVGSRVIQRTMPFGVSPRTPLPPRHPPLHTNAYDCDAGCIWGVGGWFREALI